MIDHEFEAAFAAELRGYAGDGARPVDAGRLARDLVARRVDRSRPLLRFGGSARTGRRLWMVPVAAVLMTGSLLAVLALGARSHPARLAYTDDAGLHVADRDGSNAVLIAKNLPEREGSFSTIRWSPDGRYIAALLWGHGLIPGVTGGPEQGVVRIYTADGRLTGQFSLTHHFTATLSWAPDSSRVAILDGDPAAGFKGPSIPVAWSPDGRTLALVGVGSLDGSPNAGNSLWLAQADGSGFRLLRRAPEGSSIRGASWGPDGRQMAISTVAVPGLHADADIIGWQTYSVPGEQSTVEIVDVGTGSATTIATLDGAADLLRWSPDGRDAVLRTDTRTTGAQANLHIGLVDVPMDGSAAPRELIGGDATPGDIYELPPPHDGVQPGWETAFDDGRILFVAQNPDRRLPILSIPTTGGASTTLVPNVGGMDLWTSPDGAPQPTPPPSPSLDENATRPPTITAVAVPDADAEFATWIAASTALPDGRIFVIGPASTDPSAPTRAAVMTTPGRFEDTGAPAIHRDTMRAVGLLDGSVLVIGGATDPSLTLGDSLKAEVWDPTSGRFERVGSMVTFHDDGMVTRLIDGRVLIAGGRDTSSEAGRTAEIYDPATRQIEYIGDMTSARERGTAVTLRDGRVLIVGGASGATVLDTAELFDPATGTFTPTGPMTVERRSPAAAVLADGRVLIVGGMTIDEGDTRSAEIWDPATGRFTAVGSMADARQEAGAITLPDGRVLVEGGYDFGRGTVDSSGDQNGDAVAIRSAELFDPATAAFQPAGWADAPDLGDQLYHLPDGTVLILGRGAPMQIWRPGR